MKKLFPKPGIIPAIDLDLHDAKTLIKKLENSRENISGLKIGSILVMNHGLPKVLKSLNTNIPIILDMQKGGTDIPNMVNNQIKIAASNGITAIIGAPLGAGSNQSPAGTFETFVNSCNNNDIIPIIVLEMTQPGASYFLRKNASEELAELVCKFNVPHVVAPATKPERIELYRSIFSKNAKEIEIISPGVGPQKTGNVVEDCSNALLHGADHLVVGRAIYQAKEPNSIIEQIVSKAFK